MADPMIATPAPALTEPQPRSFVERAAWAYAALQLEHDGRCPTPMFSLWKRGFDLGALGTHWPAVVAEGEILYRRHRALGILVAPATPVGVACLPVAQVGAADAAPAPLGSAQEGAAIVDTAMLADRERLVRLTERQSDILARLARGDDTEAIEHDLNIRRNTLRAVIGGILNQMRCADLPAALAIYRRAAGGTGKIS
jgi:DNA-binding CsgD family transcriptional regulator